MKTANSDTLKELFKKWKNAHGTETYKSCSDTFPLNKKNGQSPDFKTFRNSFCPDGYISDEYNKVLIICRESNVSDNTDMGEFGDFFAMQKNLDKMTAYCNFIKKALNEIGKPSTYEEVTKCAYMNLNKRGGYGSSTPERLANYAETYKDLIKEEISILEPDYIICGGTYGTLKELLPENATVLDCLHPVCGFRCKATYTPKKTD